MDKLGDISVQEGAQFIGQPPGFEIMLFVRGKNREGQIIFKFVHKVTL